MKKKRTKHDKAGERKWLDIARQERVNGRTKQGMRKKMTGNDKAAGKRKGQGMTSQEKGKKRTGQGRRKKRTQERKDLKAVDIHMLL